MEKEKLKAYLDVSTGNPKADEAIKNYLKQFVQEVPESDADAVIAVGNPKFNKIVDNWNSDTLLNFNWYFNKKESMPYYNRMQVSRRGLPYTGLAAEFQMKSAKKYIFAYGRGIEGDIAAVKKLISARNSLISSGLISSLKTESTAYIVDEYDLLGLGVMDLMHNKENQPYYNKKNGLEGEMFEKVVYDILNDNNYEVAIKTVQTLNTTSYGESTILRLKNINSEFSDKFKDAVSENSQPIVFSGGFWNDLTYWEKNSNKLMQDLLNNGRDLWEIEITGGPGQDGYESSPNYNYNDLRDYYFPALIAGVEKYSGQNNLTYVGHSNGCGVALASINKYQSSGKNDAGYYFDTTTGDYQSMDLSRNAIDTFAGEGCPGALKGYSPFYKYFGMFGEKIKTQIGDHPTAAEVSQRLFILCNTTLTGNERQYCILAAKGLGRVEGDHRLSKNLLLDYLRNVNDNSNPPQVDNGLLLRKFKLYANTDFGFVRGAIIRRVLGGKFDTDHLQHDIVVSQQDSQQISDRIVSLNGNKLYNLTDFEHGRVDYSDFTKDLEVFINEK